MNDRLVLSPPPAKDIKLSSGKSVEDSINEFNDFIEQLQKRPPQAYFDKIWPVGSVYISLNSTDPEQLFGGTWARIEGRFLLGMGFAGTTNSADHFGATTGLAAWQPDKAGETGGEAWHELTISEIPSHQHEDPHVENVGESNNNTGQPFGKGRTASQIGTKCEWYMTDGDRGAEGNEVTPLVSATGGSQQHNNMPPYFAVYMWQRTA